MGTGAADNCPGVAIDLSPSATIALTGSHTGDTSTLTGSYVGNCGSALAKEAVHSITVPEDGHVRADLGGELTTGFDATLYARSNCAVQSSEVACDDSYEKGGEVIAFEAAAGETYYIFVDGYNVEAGPYTLNVRFLPKGCGNGFVEAGEECDDGNAIDDDWCRNNCTINASPSGDTCPGMVMAMMGSGTQDRVGTLSGNTAYFTPKYASSGCAASSTGPAKDFVAAMTSDVDGTATCDLGGATSTPFDAVLYARSNCTDASSEVACHDSPMSGGEKIVFAVAKDGTYYVFVDGYGTGKAGAFKLTCTIKPAF
jgi:cysteine-rich repeat protein